MRTEADEIKAYHNVCLHRGRRLKESPGRDTELRCAFHGFAWELNGCLKQVPCQWDFPRLEPDEWSLPEVKVGTWGGFVFINIDPDCDTLEAHLGDLTPALRPLAARGAVQGGARRQGDGLQLEGGPGGLHGGVPRRCHAPAAAPEPR